MRELLIPVKIPLIAWMSAKSAAELLRFFPPAYCWLDDQWCQRCGVRDAREFGVFDYVVEYAPVCEGAD